MCKMVGTFTIAFGVLTNSPSVTAVADPASFLATRSGGTWTETVLRLTERVRSTAFGPLNEAIASDGTERRHMLRRH